MEKQFSIKEAYGFGWQTVMANKGFFAGAILLMMLAQYVPSAISEVLKKSSPGLSAVFSILSTVISIITSIGLIKIALLFCDGQKAQVKELFSNWHLFWRFLGASILVCLAVAGGMLLLIIPGIILWIRLQFYAYLLVDKETRVLESLNKSFTMTKGHAWQLFLFGLMGGLINLAGLLCLVVGLLFTIPATTIAAAFVYRKFASDGAALS